ncbi:MAG: YCF48-related protein [Ignavibacteria bacterium]
MIKIIFMLFFLIINNSYSQWIAQSSGTGSFLVDVEFLNRNTGWAVGDGGVIIKTTNAGINWLSIPNPTMGKPLFSIHIVDSNICYVVGWFETIIKTTNGGNNWIEIRNGGFGFGSSYEAVFFIDENTGWIAGTGQKILRTTNGGDSIITQPLFAGNLHDMYFKDALTGIVTGSGTDMFKTTNGGLNWINIEMPIGTRIPTFYKISFVGNQFGWVAGSDNRIFRTTNFGDTWDSISAVPVSSLTSSMRFIEFSSERTGFAGGEQGYLYKSTNEGIEWVRENSGIFPPAMMQSMYMYNDSLGWIVGGGGKIIKTTNGGQTIVNISGTTNIVPKKFSLSQNYPNPFNPSTSINYSLAQPGFVQLKIYDIRGKDIKSFINDFMNAGNYTLDIDDAGLNSGIYIYSLLYDQVIIDSKRMVYLK